MFHSTYVANEVAARSTPFDRAQDYQVSEPVLIENVCVVGYNKNSNFTKTKTSFQRFGGYPANNVVSGKLRNMAFVVMLRTEYDSSTCNCLIGKNTSNDPDQSDYSASLELSFSDSMPGGVSAPSPYPGVASSFYTAHVANVSDYYLDLKSLAGNHRYCHIQVKPDTQQSNYSLIEGHVYIHIVTSSNQRGNNPKPFVIYGQEQPGQPSPTKAWPTANVINRDIVVDLHNEQQAYLWAMVTYSRPSAQHPNHFKFEVGDPRDNAEIEVHEV